MISRESTLMVVAAHGAALDTVKRHLPLWEKASERIVIVSPLDDSVTFWEKGIDHYFVGWSSQYGPQNNLRTREALRWASEARAKLVIMVEYDALIWGPIPDEALPPDGGLSGARFTEPHEINGGSTRFTGHQYFHFPILFSPAALRPLVEVMDTLPLNAEGGYADRYIGLAAEIAGLPYVDLNERGLAFTRNRIDLDQADQCREAVRRGARFSHGIKTAEVLHRIAQDAPWKP